MRVIPAFLALVLGASAPRPSDGAEFKFGRFEQVDHGARRSFVLAADEVYYRNQHGRGGLRKLFTSRGKSGPDVAALAGPGGEDALLIAYIDGRARNEASRRYVTRRVLVRLAPQADPIAVARKSGLERVFQSPYHDDVFVFQAKSSVDALTSGAKLSALPEVVSARVLLGLRHISRSLPNDPYATDEWHVNSSFSWDINVEGAWDDGFTGDGVVIGIVDEGVEYTHPDLSPLYRVDLDWDFNDDQTAGVDPGEDDPSPESGNEDHGTGVAGVAAARGNNSIGVAGVAYDASLAALRVNGDPISYENDAGAILHLSNDIWVKNYSWGPPDDGETLEGPGSFAKPALEDSALNGRNGLGTIHVWAGGNGGGAGDDANYDGYANSIYTIAVGATTLGGARRGDSEPGACLVVAAPGSSILTTDLTGPDGQSPYNGDQDYHGGFNKTSA
ncbi:MAG: S8 family serine peptidase, partial [Pseudanabaenales cyanobacterium]|nr:S8 family serine peptidase [Pseudanabaenales cyanobacterium]